MRDVSQSGVRVRTEWSKCEKRRKESVCSVNCNKTCRHKDAVPQIFYHIDSPQHRIENSSSLPHLHSILLSIVK